MSAWLATVAGCAVFASSAVTFAFADDDPAHYPMPSGFHTDRAGCSIPDVPVPAVTPPLISAADALAPRAEPTAVVVAKDGIVMKSFTGRTELAYRRIRAQYFLQQHDVPAAIREYRLAAATARTAGDQPSYHDLVTRLPLSVLLYRAGRITEARTEWRAMLSDRVEDAKRYRMPALTPQPPAVDLLAQRRLDALADRELPGGWAGFYNTGAGQHMARGFQAVKRGDDARAVAEWRCAAQASPEFEAPHLMLGYAAALRGDVRTAKREWIATLEGFNGGPGDMMSITGWQFDAMDALLRYT
jgi:hypothetical protein